MKRNFNSILDDAAVAARTILSLLTVTFSVLTANAATKSWDGSASGFWNVAANWTNNAAPVNGDALVFPDGPTRLTITNTLGAATNFTSIRFSGPDYMLFGPPLSITNGLTNATIFIGENTIRSAITPRATQTWSVVSRSTLTLSSNVAINSITITGAVNGTLRLDGTVSGNSTSRFIKDGAGRMLINGIATLALMDVTNGTLQVDGQLTSEINIADGATLSGIGTVNSFFARGVVSPGGTAPGRLTVAGSGNSAVFTGGSSLALQLNGPVPGTSHDQLLFSRQFQLLSVALEASIGSEFTPLPGQSFIIISNATAGAVIGSFSGLPEGGTFTVGTTTFRISYAGGDGNDVVLRVIGASGETRIWDGGAANNTWLDALNWDGNIQAFDGDSLVFPSSVPVTKRTNQNNFPAGTPFNRVAVGGTNWNLSGNPIRLLGGLEVTNRTSGAVPTINLPIVLDTNQTWSVQTNSLTMRGALNLGTNTLIVQATNGQLRLVGPVTGTGRIVKRGPGDLDLSGTNTFTGGVRIENGLVVASGLHLSGPPWEMVNPAGRLSIASVVPGLNASAGVVRIPFASSGSRVAGNFNLGPTVTLDYSDAINTLSVTGAVNLAGATLTGLPSSGGALQFGSTESVLIQNDGADPVIGGFAGLAEGTFVPTSSSGLSNRITYIGGDGNDVALRSVPPAATHITRVWDGDSTNASWATTGNWVGNVRPRPGDDVLFPVNAQQKRNHINTENSLILFLANSLRFDGADYVITNIPPSVPLSFNLGVVVLTEGIRAAQPFGTNTLGTIVAVAADQDWDVASGDAVLRFNGAATGLGTVRKTGPGWLEGEGALFTNGVRFVNGAGRSRFRDSAFESIAVSTGMLELTSGGAASLSVTGGVAKLSGAVAASLSVTGAELQLTAGTIGGGNGLLPGLTTNFNLGTNARCVVEFSTSNSVAVLLLGSMSINGAQLDVRVNYPIRPGEILSVAAPFPAGQLVLFPSFIPLPTNQPPPATIVGTFNGLPNGAVTNFSGRPYRINYALTNGPNVLPGVFLTALPRAPQFTNVVRQVSGLVVLQGTAEPANNLILEGSQDFVQWTVLANTTANATGQFQMTDTLATGLTHRFYRARSQ